MIKELKETKNEIYDRIIIENKGVNINSSLNELCTITSNIKELTKLIDYIKIKVEFGNCGGSELDL